MAGQAKNGKAFEWAVAKAINELTGYEIFVNNAAQVALTCYESVTNKQRQNYVSTAFAGVSHILDKERSRLDNKACQISLASDVEGQTGDVRDVLICGDDFVIGISCKTNHDALKHSRLSDKRDFIKQWGLNPDGCSQAYWTIIKDLFGRLRVIKKQSKGKALWSELGNYQQEYYWPILDAFTDEIKRLQTQNGIAGDLLSYLVGKHDFYKVISSSKKVEIQAFNFNGTLSVQKSKLPDSIVGIDKKNGGQYSKTIRFNRGYTINFRIHNASSRVEPSLKFDIKALSFPPREIYNHHIEL
jgi:HaeIII restriction endonuclease